MTNRPDTPGSLVPAGGYPLYTDSASLNEARKKFASHLLGARTQLLVTVKERAETARTIGRGMNAMRLALNKQYRTDAAKGVRDRLQKAYNNFNVSKPGAVTRSNMNLVRGINKDATDLWLEWNYGVAPLVSDIENAAKVIREGQKVRIKVSGRSEFNAAFNNLNRASFGTDGHLPCLSRMDGVKTVRHVYRIGACLSEPDTVSVPEQLGLSLPEVIPSLWEMIPYSFVVDYFTNTGDVVNALAASTIATRGLYQSTLVVTEEEQTWKYAPAGVYAPNGGTHTGKKVSVQFDRITSGISLVPTFELQEPTVHQMANLAALALNKLVSGKRLFTPIL